MGTLVFSRASFFFFFGLQYHHLLRFWDKYRPEEVEEEHHSSKNGLAQNHNSPSRNKFLQEIVKDRHSFHVAKQRFRAWRQMYVATRYRRLRLLSRAFGHLILLREDRKEEELSLMQIAEIIYEKKCLEMVMGAWKELVRQGTLLLDKSMSYNAWRQAGRGLHAFELFRSQHLKDQAVTRLADSFKRIAALALGTNKLLSHRDRKYTNRSHINRAGSYHSQLTSIITMESLKIVTTRKRDAAHLIESGVAFSVSMRLTRSMREWRATSKSSQGQRRLMARGRVYWSYARMQKVIDSLRLQRGKHRLGNIRIEHALPYRRATSLRKVFFMLKAAVSRKASMSLLRRKNFREIRWHYLHRRGVACRRAFTSWQEHMERRKRPRKVHPCLINPSSEEAAQKLEYTEASLR